MTLPFPPCDMNTPSVSTGVETGSYISVRVFAAALSIATVLVTLAGMSTVFDCGLDGGGASGFFFGRPRFFFGAASTGTVSVFFFVGLDGGGASGFFFGRPRFFFGAASTGTVSVFFFFGLDGGSASGFFFGRPRFFFGFETFVPKTYVSTDWKISPNF